MKRKKPKVRRTPRKKWVNSNKPVFNRIQFDSDMELLMYKLLRAADIDFKYIGKDRAKYKLIEQFNYEGECYERAQKRSKSMRDVSKVSETGYSPDFVAKDESWFIEVKGRKLGDFNLRWKLFKEKMNLKEPPPLLFMPVTKEDCQQVVEILKNKDY